LGDILRYRIPGKKVDECFGTFRSVEDTSGLTGFIVTDFEHQKIYAFNEGSAEPEMHFTAERPFIVSQQEYEDIASVFLASFRRAGVEKAVFSRIKEVDLDPQLCNKFFDALAEEYPEAFVYLISSELFGTWIGATPERLISVRSGLGSTVSLAGTKKADDETPWGEKESKEQLYVTEFILDKLSSSGLKDIRLGERYEAIAGPVKHLKNDIEFSMKEADALSIAFELHPTPAVSGFPREESIHLIKETEPHERALYAGFIGWIGNGSCDLFVNLRCCSVGKEKAYLYLGGGFTADSSVQLEWQETENKSRTLLNIIQNL
jgi:isochorismate synthase